MGPLFTREVVTAPRRTRFYIFRAVYAAVLLILMSTAWQVLAGTQWVRNTGDLARFGAMVFQILAPMHLAVVVFFSALSAASSVALEKDRRTLDLLLLTSLSNVELVLGKLLASMVSVLVLIATVVPLFMLAALLGGVSFGQIGMALLVTLASALVAGSLGSTLAFWREKTFQSLAITGLVLVLWSVVGQIIALGALGDGWAGMGCQSWSAVLSPWHAILEATRPFELADSVSAPWRDPVGWFLLVAAAVAAVLNTATILLVRVWNPSRQTRAAGPSAQNREVQWGAGSSDRQHAAGHAWHLASAEAIQAPATTDASRQASTRQVWDNPIIWREVRTWAYGRKVLLVRAIYLLFFALAAAGLGWLVGDATALSPGQAARHAALALVPLFVLSLMLVNTQAVTALTSERDARALDLLLVTDLTAKEFVYGKLGGILYNTKEMILLPMALCAYLAFVGVVGAENLAYLLAGWLLMVAFAAMLGFHCGMTYANSRTAIAVSLGTVFFLFVGVATSMRMMVAFSGSFQTQLQPFLASMVGGGVGLYVALGHRNPSPAISAASFLLPFATFYALTSYLLHSTLAVFLVVTAAYGFATAAMLVPAVFEFDVATGRTVGGESK